MPLPESPRTICILRLSALGDVCNLVPAVCAIQRRHPQASITWVIGKAEYLLLQGLEGVEFIVYDKASGVKGLLELRRSLNERCFDVLLLMQVALRASALSLAIRARTRLGFDRKRAKDFQWLVTNHHIPESANGHVLDGFLDFARMLGARDLSLRWNIPIPPEEREKAQLLVPENTPYIVLSPCSTQRTRNFRNWSAQGYAEVIRHIAQQYGIATILTGGRTSTELQYGEQISLLTPDTTVNAIGGTSLKTLLALIGGAVAVIAPDSGPMHMATAMGTPAIGLYAGSNPLRTGPYLSQQWVVNRYPHAVRTYMGTSEDKLRWGQRVRHPHVMDIIKPIDVIEKFDTLMLTVKQNQ
ncbi:glycosyltransferase family 9 protein [Desulfurispirillum indicum]|uniref:glycosyltransferase family 9 protein n=1 Tax=Desulfurispirillum indicum TaxID=936456 RepID=UPI001CFA90FA|nr:glycosyltransferase family 9 protein [Desulfurispirillum indicum]UCZ57778.1 glycosyltransferase family 9 protein [Desulfurispirillum indicum]